MAHLDNKEEVDKCVNLFFSLSENDQQVVIEKLIDRRYKGGNTMQVQI